MTKILNFALKIKGGGRECSTCEVLRPCHPPKIWNVHLLVKSCYIIHKWIFKADPQMENIKGTKYNISAYMVAKETLLPWQQQHTVVTSLFNPIHTGGVFSTSRPVNCSQLHNETSYNLETFFTFPK